MTITTPTLWKSGILLGETGGKAFGHRGLALTNGNFLVAWTEADNTVAPDPGHDLMATLYNALGEVLVPAIQLNSLFVDENEQLVDVAAMPGGGFIAVYQHVTSANRNLYDLAYERFNEGGTQIGGGLITQNGALLPGSMNQSVSVHPNGSFNVVYSDNHGFENMIVTRNVASDGTVGPQVVLRDDDSPSTSASSPQYHDVTTLTNGTIVAVYLEEDGGDNDVEVLGFNPFNASLSFARSEVSNNTANEYNPQVTALDDGGFVVAWKFSGTGADQLKQVIYNADGTVRVPEFSSAIAYYQFFDSIAHHDVVGLDDGGYITAHNHHSSGAFMFTSLQRFDSNGVKIGADYISPMPMSSLELLSDGRVMVTQWEDPTTSETIILDTREPGITLDGTEGQATGRQEASQITGTNNPDWIYGVDGNDLIAGRGGADFLSGGNGADFILGGSGVDTIQGNESNDTLDGGSGTDFINGGSGNDRLIGGTEDDQLQGGLGFDTADYSVGATGGGVFNLTSGRAVVPGLGSDSLDSIEGIIATPFNDSIYGNSGDNIVDAGAGDDTVSTFDGIDSIDLGDGRDRAFGGNGDDQITGGAGNDTLNGNNDDDILRGGDDADRLYGGNGNDRLEGEGGDDLLVGGQGVDILIGGLGNDRVFADGNDPVAQVLGGDGVDRLIGQGSIGLNYDLALNGFESAFGTSGNDSFDGRTLTLRTVQVGHGGDDTLVGGSANDLLQGRDGDDHISGSAGNDYIAGHAGADYLSGGQGTDTIFGGTGDDIILGGGGNDLLYGDAGNDQIDGGPGNDDIRIDSDDNTALVFGGDGTDIVRLQGSDVFGIDMAAQGFEVAYGNSARNIITADGGGAARMYGLGGDDHLIGSAFDDVLLGGDGDDWLSGGQGNNTMHGGDGNDAGQLPGNSFEYQQFVISPDSVRFVSLIDGDETIMNFIEVARFDDGDFAI